VALLGLLSDTHVPHRMAALPPSLFERLAGVDLILHAGDVDDPAVLEDLSRVAPVAAVRGNWHLLAPWPNDRRLPAHLALDVAGRRVVLAHGHVTLWNSLWEKVWMFTSDHRGRANRRMVRRLARAFPGADVYVFGHSHRALVERHGGALFVNPGAVCPTPGEVASVARLSLTPGGVEAEIVPL
jgi:putative phosphoesterase